MSVSVEPIGVDHQRAGADQQVAETGARGNARVPVVGGVRGRQCARFLDLAVGEHPVPRHEHIVELDDAGRLAVFGGELGGALTRPSCGPSNDGDARRIARHRTTDGEAGIVRRHRPARHHQEFVDVRRGRDDGLGAANDDAILAALLDVHINVRIVLLPGLFRPIALSIGHGDAKRQIAVLNIMHIGDQALMIFRFLSGARGVGIDLVGRLENAVQRIVREIAHGAAGLRTQQADSLELV